MENSGNRAPTKGYDCLHCSRRFSTKPELEIHIEIDHSDVKTKYMCNICGDLFYRSSVCAVHAMRHGSPQKQCPSCPSKFHTEHQLKEHQLAHGAEKTHKCRFCPKMFGTAGNRGRHEKTAHPKEFAEELAKKQESAANPHRSRPPIAARKKLAPLSEIDNNNNQQQEQNDVQEYLIEEIDESMEFVSENEQQQGEQYETIYIDDHSENAASIEVNNDYQQQGEQWESFYGSNEKFALEDNAEIIHFETSPHTHSTVIDSSQLSDEPIEIVNSTTSTQISDSTPPPLPCKQNKKFPCEICGRQFTLKGNLKQHMNTHLSYESKPYSCDLCHEKFTQMGNLRYHKKVIHKVINTYSCDMCDAEFSDNVQLIEHRHALGHLLRPKSTLKKCRFRKSCAEMFETQDELDQHNNRFHHHTCEDPTCVGIWFTKRSTLMAHNRKFHNANEKLAEVKQRKIQHFMTAIRAMDWDSVDFLQKVQPESKELIMLYYKNYDKLEGWTHPDRVFKEIMKMSEEKFIEKLSEDPHFKETLRDEFDEKTQDGLVTIPFKLFNARHAKRIGATYRPWQCRAYEHHLRVSGQINNYMNKSRNTAGEKFFVSIEFPNFLCPLIERVMMRVYEKLGDYISPDVSSLVKDQLKFLSTIDPARVYIFYWKKKYIPVMQVIPSARKYLRTKLSYENAWAALERKRVSGKKYKFSIGNSEQSEASEQLKELIMGELKKEYYRYHYL